MFKKQAHPLVNSELIIACSTPGLPWPEQFTEPTYAVHKPTKLFK
ncbi:hypothetical protein N483_24840 [Pseudoalteromonas luteoviolacea NCIMB 1944]|nr:hypothetical protein N483_24840 [Pseudoalteromonas luteoviolacea NCIMB 1944]